MSGVDDAGVIGGVNLPSSERADPVTRLCMSALAATQSTAATRRRQSIASRREVRAILRALRELLG